MCFIHSVFPPLTLLLLLVSVLLDLPQITHSDCKVCAVICGHVRTDREKYDDMFLCYIFIFHVHKHHIFYPPKWSFLSILHECLSMTCLSLWQPAIKFTLEYFHAAAAVAAVLNFLSYLYVHAVRPVHIYWLRVSVQLLRNWLAGSIYDLQSNHYLMCAAETFEKQLQKNISVTAFVLFAQLYWNTK